MAIAFGIRELISTTPSLDISFKKVVSASRGKAFEASCMHSLQPMPLPTARPSPLAEPLTGRKREVLRLLLEGAPNREIARRLFLSVNTLKTSDFD